MEYVFAGFMIVYILYMVYSKREVRRIRREYEEKVKIMDKLADNYNQLYTSQMNLFRLSEDKCKAAVKASVILKSAFQAQFDPMTQMDEIEEVNNQLNMLWKTAKAKTSLLLLEKEKLEKLVKEIENELNAQIERGREKSS